jgi:lipopolysaccharide/colanic/teichoic acid biosynthesis glycosyltransferase
VDAAIQSGRGIFTHDVSVQDIYKTRPSAIGGTHRRLLNIVPASIAFVLLLPLMLLVAAANGLTMGARSSLPK